MSDERLLMLENVLPKLWERPTSTNQEPLDIVVKSWEKGLYPEIIQYTQTSLQEEQTDALIIMMYLYAIWVTAPYCGLHQILQFLQQWMSSPKIIQHWKSHDLKHLSKAFNIFLRKCVSHLEHYQNFPNKKDHDFSSTNQELSQLLTLLSSINDSFDDSILLLRRLKNLNERFTPQEEHYEPVQNQAVVQNNRDDEQRETTILETITLGTTTLETTALETASRESSMDGTSKMVDSEEMIEGAKVKATPSAKLKALLEFMETFETLIEKEHWHKAAIAMDCIEQEITEFNPVTYFPHLFTDYIRLKAQHASPLMQCIHQDKDSPQWQSLSEYFHVDQQGFKDIATEVSHDVR